MYRLSYQYYGLIGFSVTVAVAILVSLLTGKTLKIPVLRIIFINNEISGRQDHSKIPDRFFLYKAFSKSKSNKEELEDVGFEWSTKPVSAEYEAVPINEPKSTTTTFTLNQTNTE